MGRRKDVREDLREIIQLLDSASFHVNSLISFARDLLANYHRFLEEVISATWIAERCGELSEKLKEKYGHKR